MLAAMPEATPCLGAELLLLFEVLGTLFYASLQRIPK